MDLEEQKQTNQNDYQPTGKDAEQLECTDNASGKARLYGHSGKQSAFWKFPQAKHTFTAQSSNSTICQSKVLTYV